MGRPDPNFYITEICYKSKSPVFIHYRYNKTFQVTSTWITWSMGHVHLIALFLARQPKCTQSFWTPTRHPGQLLISLFPPRLWSQPQTCWDQVLLASFPRSEFKLIHKSQPFYMFWLSMGKNVQSSKLPYCLNTLSLSELLTVLCVLSFGFSWFWLVFINFVDFDLGWFLFVLVSFI